MTRLLQDWVAEAAQRRPQATAVVGKDETLTYGELEASSNRLARILREHGCGRGHRAAVLMPDSAQAVASFVGVMKAGGAYVPLDPAGGMARNADIIRKVEPDVILTDRCDWSVMEALDARGVLREVRLGCLGRDAFAPLAEFTGLDLEGMSGEPVNACADPAETAYILFSTSSSGSIKGVPITHENVRPFIEWAVAFFELGPEDRLAGHTPLTFGLSALDIFATFAAVGQLHRVPREDRLLRHDVVTFMAEREITFWVSVPAPLERVARFHRLDAPSLPHLRHVAWSGDMLRARALRYWKERLPDVAFTNLYGVTEAAIASSYYRVPHDFPWTHGEIPIGNPCPGEDVLILDAELRPAPVGVAGDIYLSGVGLSRGYWRDPERTRAAFLPAPAPSGDGIRLHFTGDRGRRRADGTIEFLGPADSRITTPQCQVEPVEVEKAVLQLEEVTACLVVPIREEPIGDAGVGCAYVPSDGEPLRTGELRDRLVGRLPEHMIPSRWMVLDELPRDNRGKADRVLTRILLDG